MSQVTVTDGRLLFLNAKDNVCTAITPIAGGTTLEISGQTVLLKQDIPLGFKIASCNIARDESIVKYGVSIGSATRDIVRGDLVHLHNMKSDYLPTYTLDKEDSHAR
ncbi:MAG TPA: UxaA family hydrolase [Acidobacteriaceae bacterium]|nr:UxaA family hydrolase [Acidobacteriaceae bacterium]